MNRPVTPFFPPRVTLRDAYRNPQSQKAFGLWERLFNHHTVQKAAFTDQVAEPCPGNESSPKRLVASAAGLAVMTMVGFAFRDPLHPAKPLLNKARSKRIEMTIGPLADEG